MRQILVFTVALLFTFAYCATQFTAVGIIYCPNKKEWEYRVSLWDRSLGKGQELAKTWGVGDAQVQFYELSTDTNGGGSYAEENLGISVDHTCLESPKTQLWEGYPMYATLDEGYVLLQLLHRKKANLVSDTPTDSVFMIYATQRNLHNFRN